MPGRPGRHVLCRTPGTAQVTLAFRPGDGIRLELPVASRWIAPDPCIDALCGTAVVQCGPLVYCAESVRGVTPRARAQCGRRLRAATPPGPGATNGAAMLLGSERALSGVRV
ncbi:hypothetical protein ADL01_25645 [Streptomyces sp. NRRL WC-3618]|uniref:hypothetical protein n=1 Tax=Streptomyces sp. NRRL WC-3618 TaxID=1519490 RepID=UPI0006AE38A1|nr:hypothetical protein [Streptomyces sp. NRRL WC-3618]KOV66736.1 hypothetical protein ADL01_25645 [Streptomyces sp. NRRL WC-3618]